MEGDKKVTKFYFFFILSDLRNITPNNTKSIASNQFFDWKASTRAIPKKRMNIVIFGPNFIFAPF
jgi:hypothetical protein